MIASNTQEAVAWRGKRPQLSLQRPGTAGLAACRRRISVIGEHPVEAEGVRQRLGAVPLLLTEQSCNEPAHQFPALTGRPVSSNGHAVKLTSGCTHTSK